MEKTKVTKYQVEPKPPTIITKFKCVQVYISMPRRTCAASNISDKVQLWASLLEVGSSKTAGCLAWGSDICHQMEVWKSATNWSTRVHSGHQAAPKPPHWLLGHLHIQFLEHHFTAYICHHIFWNTCHQMEVWKSRPKNWAHTTSQIHSWRHMCQKFWLRICPRVHIACRRKKIYCTSKKKNGAVKFVISFVEVFSLIFTQPAWKHIIYFPPSPLREGRPWGRLGRMSLA